MKKRILAVLLVMVIIFLLVACKQDKEVNVLLPPEKGEDVTFKTSSLIYQNEGSTTYSIGGIGPIFIFYDDILSVKDVDEIRTFEISYDQTPLTVEGFKKQFQKIGNIPDIASYNDLAQYNLCASTNKLPGYRLYILDDQYWIGTLYRNSVWRIVSIDIEK